MTSPSTVRLVRAALAVALFISIDVTAATAGVTSLWVTSDGGDPIGHGRPHFVAATDATFTGYPDAHHQSASYVMFDVIGPDASTLWWRLSFATADDAPMAVGVYENAQYAGSQSPGRPGLSVSSAGAFCSSITGRFEVLEVTYGANNALVSFRATFEQRCDDAEGGLQGEILYNATVPFYLATSAVDTSVIDGQEVVINVSALNITNPPVALHEVNSPAGAAFTDHGNGTGTLTWTPSLLQTGTHLIGFRGTDADDRIEKVFVSVTVTPSNDSFESSRTLAVSGNGGYQGSLAAATNQEDEYGALDPSVWFRFTAPSTGRWVLEVTSPTISPELIVFVDSTPQTPPLIGELSQVGIVRPDSTFLSDDRVVLETEAGKTYFVAVHGRDPGLFTLTWRPAHLSRILWKHSTGMITIWTVDDSGTIVSHPTYGPFSGWQPTRLAVDNDGDTRVLWRHESGLATLWRLDASGLIAASPVFGPHADWTVADVTISGYHGDVHLMWRSDWGGIAIWHMSEDADSITSSAAYGPYAGWDPLGIAVDGDVNRRVLWQGNAGVIGLWKQAWPYSTVNDFGLAGPFDGWTPMDLAAGSSDDSTRLLWQHSTGAAGLWRLHYGGVDSTTYGPFPGWQAIALAVPNLDWSLDYGDTYSRVLWRHASGAIALWKTGSTGTLARSFIFGPYSGWSVVDVAVGPD